MKKIVLKTFNANIAKDIFPKSKAKTMFAKDAKKKNKRKGDDFMKLVSLADWICCLGIFFISSVLLIALLTNILHRRHYEDGHK